MKTIDVYGFDCNLMDNIVWWPWDKVTMRLDSTLPIKEHTRTMNWNNTVFAMSTNDTRISKPVLYMPSDPACYLANIFGDDFRIPKKTKFFRHNATDLPVCKTSALDATEKLEFMRQLMLGGTCEPSSMNHDAIANFSSGLSVTSRKVC